jgi:hypothetical protein
VTLIAINADTRAIDRMAAQFRAAGNQTPHIIRRALNHTGDKVRTAMIRAVTASTGLKRNTIARALKAKRANYGALQYVIHSKGGNVSLKYFDPKETRRGVTAKRVAGPLSNRTFMKGGRFPKRVALRLGGHVYERVGKNRLPIRKVKSGVLIPRAMVTGDSAATFHASVEAWLPARLAHELNAILSGAAPRG